MCRLPPPPAFQRLVSRCSGRRVAGGRRPLRPPPVDGVIKIVDQNSTVLAAQDDRARISP